MCSCCHWLSSCSQSLSKSAGGTSATWAKVDELRRRLNVSEEKRVTDMENQRIQMEEGMARREAEIFEQVTRMIAASKDLVDSTNIGKNCTTSTHVHVSGTGDFLLSKIELLKDPCSLNVKKEGDLMDADEVNDLQTWPTEAEMAEADKSTERKEAEKVDSSSGHL